MHYRSLIWLGQAGALYIICSLLFCGLTLIGKVEFGVAVRSQFLASGIVSSCEGEFVSAKLKAAFIPNETDDVEKGLFFNQILNLAHGVRSLFALFKVGIRTARNYFVVQKQKWWSIGCLSVAKCGNLSRQRNSDSEISRFNPRPTTAVVYENQREPERRLILHIGSKIVDHIETANMHFGSQVFLNRREQEYRLQKGNYCPDCADHDEPERVNREFPCIQGERSIKGRFCGLALLSFGILIGGWGGAILLVGGNDGWGCAAMLFGVALSVWAFGLAGGLWSWNLTWYGLGVCASYGA